MVNSESLRYFLRYASVNYPVVFCDGALGGEFEPVRLPPSLFPNFFSSSLIGGVLNKLARWQPTGPLARKPPLYGSNTVSSGFKARRLVGQVQTGVVLEHGGL
jgi:hypothetical protein